MSVTIRTKLALFGGIALTAMVISTLVSYERGLNIANLNDAARVTQSNKVMTTRNLGYAETIQRRYYAAVMDAGKGAVSDDDKDAIATANEKMQDMTERLIARDLSYLKKADFDAALALGADITRITEEELPRLLAGRTSGAALATLTATLDEKLAALKILQVAMDDAVYEDLSAISDEVRNQVLAANRDTLIVLGASFAFMLPLMLMLILGITRPLRAVIADINRLAAGDFSRELAGRGRKDEIGAVVNALLGLQAATSERAKAEAQAELRAKAAAEEERVQAMARIADSFEASVTGMVSRLASATVEMQAAAQDVTQIATDTQARSGVVVTASTDAAQISAQVAAAAEELTASIQEISAQTQKSNRIVGEAAAQAERAKEAISALSEKAGHVGKIIEVITGIAQQINLLALNATIESARAGEAGKGFAVVAGEVKSLAAQVSSAADEITRQINEMQAATTGSVDSVMGILAIVDQVSASTSSVAASVEEQSAVTNEIARNVALTSDRTHEISENMSNVQGGAGRTRETACQVLEAAKGLKGQFDLLQRNVDQFLHSVRA